MNAAAGVDAPEPRVSSFDELAHYRQLADHHRQRIRELDAEARMRGAEERRLYRLLALALSVATREGRDCSPSELLEALCALDGTDPATPAWVEEERANTRREPSIDELIVLLRETAPEPHVRVAA